MFKDACPSVVRGGRRREDIVEVNADKGIVKVIKRHNDKN